MSEDRTYTHLGDYLSGLTLEVVQSTDKRILFARAKKHARILVAEERDFTLAYIIGQLSGKHGFNRDLITKTLVSSEARDLLIAIKPDLFYTSGHHLASADNNLNTADGDQLVRLAYEQCNLSPQQIALCTEDPETFRELLKPLMKREKIIFSIFEKPGETGYCFGHFQNYIQACVKRRSRELQSD